MAPKMCAPFLLALAAAIDQDDWRLSEDAFQTPEQLLSYETVSGKYCKGNNIHAGVHPSLTQHQCANKCGPGSTCDGEANVGDCAACSGYIRAYDEPTVSDSVCLPAADCEELCRKMPGCYGVTSAVNQAEHKRCYLKTMACLTDVLDDTLSVDANYDFKYLKLDATETCQMGYGARIVTVGKGLETYEQGLAGIYDRTSEDPPIYSRVDGTDRIVWHDSGCGWAVEKKSDSGGSRRLNTACEDDLPAVAAAFGLDAHEDLCGVDGWVNEYCSHPLYAAVCARSCGVSTEQCQRDHEQAAKMLGDILEVEGCAGALPYCGSPLVRTVCKTTCGDFKGHRELPENFVVSFRASLKTRSVRRLGWNCEGQSETERDCTAATYYEVAYSFKPSVAPAAADACVGVEKVLPAKGPQANVYDVLKLHSQTSQVWTHSCASYDAYITVDRKYCPHNNVKTYGAGVNAQVSVERCVSKCSGGGPQDEKPNHGGTVGHCNGWDAEFTETSNALCLPRSACETLCDTLGAGECESVDMHLTKSRCWLNRPYCSPAKNPYTLASKGFDYGQSGIYQASDDHEFVYRATGSNVYTTMEGKDCLGIPIDVFELEGNCLKKCGGAALDSHSVKNTNDNADAAATFYGYTGMMAASHNGAFLAPYHVVLVEYGTVVVGFTDYTTKKTFFGTNQELPHSELTDAGITNWQWEAVRVVAHEGTKISVISALPGRGVVTVSGVVDLMRLSVTWGTANFVEASSFGPSVVVQSAVGGTDGSVYAGLVGAANETDVNGTESEEIRAYSLLVRADGTGVVEQLKKNRFTTTTTSTTSEAWGYGYTDYGDDSRRLQDWASEDSAFFQKNYTEAEWTTAAAALNAAVTIDVARTTDYTAYAVVADGALSIFTSADGVVTLFPPPNTPTCAAGVTITHIRDNYVLFTCANWGAQVCDLSTQSCGAALADWGTDATTAYASADSSAGFSTVCPTTTTCVAKTNDDLVTLLPIAITGPPDALDLGFGVIAVSKALLNPGAEESSIIALGQNTLFIPRGVMYADQTARDQSVLDPPDDADPTDSASESFKTHGMLFWELGATWSAVPAGHCSALDAGSARNATNASASNTSMESLSFPTGYEICGARADCEAACSEKSGCVAFSFVPQSYYCYLYSQCEEDSVPGSTLVKKTQTEQCRVKVESAVIDDDEVLANCTYTSDSVTKSTCGLDGTYVKTKAGEYMRADNATKITWGAPPHGSQQPCLGWVMSQNRKAAEHIVVTTFKNADDAVLNAYWDQYHANQSGFTVDAEWVGKGKPSGCADLCAPGESCPPPTVLPPDSWNCNNTALAALCGASCNVQQTFGSIADQTGIQGHVIASASDYDAAAAEYKDVGGACSDFCDCAGKKNEMCSDDPVINWLCPTACRRRGRRDGATYEEQKLDFLDTDGWWSDVFRTFANGSDVAHRHTYDANGNVPVYGYGQCIKFGPSEDESMLKRPKVYRATAPLAKLRLQNSCANEGYCPSMTTCVQSAWMYEKEMNRFRDGFEWSQRVATLPAVNITQLLASTQWTDAYDTPDFSDSEFTTKLPKVISTVTRTDAFIRTVMWEFGKEIARAAPGSSRLRLRQVGSADTLLVTLGTNEAGPARKIFGRGFEVPAGFNGWQTDIVRIEAFDKDRSPALSAAEVFKFELFVPGVSAASFRVFRFAEGANGVDVSTLGGSVAAAEGENAGWFVVSIPASLANGDFAGSVDVDECALGTDGCEKPDDGGECHNSVPGYTCRCSVRTGYVGVKCEGGTDGRAVCSEAASGDFAPGEQQCVLGSSTYTAPTQEFLVYHSDAVELGWHVSEILAFEGVNAQGECVGLCGGKTSGLSTNCRYGAEVGHSTDKASDAIEDVTVSGSYPSHEADTNLFKSGAAGEWWTDMLSLDRSQGTGGWLSFRIKADTKYSEVNCVRLTMPCALDAPRKFTLHRGKKGAATNTGAFSTSGVSFTEAGTPGWCKSTSKTRGADSVSVDLPINCGEQGSQYFGELFRDWSGVSSPCECKQLCLDHVDEGCATWKWYKEHNTVGGKQNLAVGHCYLQRDVFVGSDATSQGTDGDALAAKRASYRSRYESGTGWWKRPKTTGWPGWWTGDTGPVAMGFTLTPGDVVVNQEFGLRVWGVGFPLEEGKKDCLGSRQRIKIVTADESCASALPPTYIEGIGCTNALTCTPRPTAYSRTDASWAGLKFSSAKEATAYKVCWCAEQCWNAVNWVTVPGDLEVKQSGYSWAFETAGFVFNSITARNGVSIRVSRPAFAGTADVADWRLKLVKSVYECSNLGDTKVCSGAAHCGNATTADYGPDEAVWTITVDATLEAGTYHVCHQETTDGDWTPIPSATSRYLTVAGLESDASHPRGPFHHQRFSARAGAATDVKVSGYRMWAPNQLSVAVVKKENGGCYANATSPGKGMWKNRELRGIIAVLHGHWDTSTSDEYHFKGVIPPEASGEYSLCMCTEEDSWTAERYYYTQYTDEFDAGYSSDPSGLWYYYNETAYESEGGFSRDASELIPAVNLTQNSANFNPGYGVTKGKVDEANAVVLDDAATKHLCVPKCGAGCVGSTCFCDGLDENDAADSKVLCMSAAMCRATCSLLAYQPPLDGCNGYSIHKSKNRCFLTTDATAVTDSDDYDFWTMKTIHYNDGDSGRHPCRAPRDFVVLANEDSRDSWRAKREVNLNVGKLFVTQKVDVGVEYVATPNELTSVEITGTGLDVGSDRLMVMDCFGTCGVTGPSKFVDIPVPSFHEFVAMNAMIDRPSLNEEATVEDTTSASYSYTVQEQKYCPGKTLALDVSPLAANSQCYKKCFENAPCTTDGACFCEGYKPGHDFKDSTALCLDVTQCEHLCSQTPGCFSVDMHRTLPRCFLNMQCAESELKPDADYNWNVRVLDDNTRRLLAQGRSLSPAQARKLLVAEDPGLSWESILRFKGLTMLSGGEFKLCFCDSSMLGANEICAKPEHYTVEVGSIHATGLQCLLTNPKMTRGTCQSQAHGGLRCYDSAAPSIEVPTAYLGVPHPDPAQRSALAKTLMSFCQFAPLTPAELAKGGDFHFCTSYRAGAVMPPSSATSGA